MDLSIISAAKELHASDAATYGAAAANIPIRLNLQANLEGQIDVTNPPIEMRILARDLTDLVAACLTGADKAKILARALADLQRMAPEVAERETTRKTLDSITETKGREPDGLPAGLPQFLQPKEGES